MKTKPSGGGSVAATVISIDTGRVRPFADQPREYFDAGELVSLELSIKQRGQLQPAMVRRLSDDRDHDYELVDGQRRWHACTRLDVPLRAMIIDPHDPEDQFEIAVAANFQRAGHTPMEIAKAIERMCTQGKRTAGYVATLFGKSDAWVVTTRRLIDLVPEIQAQLEPSAQEPLALSIAIHLARLPKEKQLPALQEIQARDLSSSRAIDKIRRMLLDGTPEYRGRSHSHQDDKILHRYVRRTIQDADRMFDRLGPDEFRLMVNLMYRKKTLDGMRDSVMTAIGRLEVLHRRLTECKPSALPEAKPAVNAAARKAATNPPTNGNAFVYSHPMKCPKCTTAGSRFRRRRDADLDKEYWICQTKGCQLKISHYSIKVDRNYPPAIHGGPDAATGRQGEHGR